ncbi:hypothetical protein A8709_21800 [Paenibacillus pectinilyticus]|uniref:HTH araC/xylS-type domain-containing protein n=1 Tax=Paenibacillus pectinilyticus TaxID=512399 RepID=A0A1C0ZY01_9BACL|nr:AraC family transcriptional regulator [Paenibacillus pectinilyticus]OCT12959.1 hypothetical protein A8709_21800 [Paenibacillus pectinilyticus]
MRLNYFMPKPQNEHYVCFPESFGHYYEEPAHREVREGGQLTTYNLHIVSKGKGYLKLGGEIVEMQAGSGFLYGQACEQSYYADEEDPWEVRWVHFWGAGVESLLQGKGEDKVWLFSWQGNEQIIELMDDMLACGESFAQKKEPHLSAVLYELLAELVQHAENLQGAPVFEMREKMLKASEWIRVNCQQTMTLKEMAAMIGLSPFYFSRQFHHMIGKAPSEFLLESRILKSKQLLVGTDMTVKEIAERVGFSQSSYYIKRFRLSEGMTPEQFRLMRKS